MFSSSRGSSSITKEPLPSLATTHVPEYALLSHTLVTCAEGRNQPSLIANYTRNPIDRLQDGREACKSTRTWPPLWVISFCRRVLTVSQDDCLQRAENQSEDFRIWQAARATSAAQTFLKPYVHAASQMHYVDGAIVRNNPVRLAYEEANRVWRTGAKPDIMLSIGTGIQTSYDGQIHDRKDEKLNRIKNLLPQRIRKQVETGLDMVQATLDCHREWVDFKSAFRGQLGQNCHRLDVGLLNKPPALDDQNSIGELTSSSRDYFRDGRYSGRYMQPEYQKGRDHIKVIARRLRASLFYLGHALPTSMPAGVLATKLCCRLSPQSDAAVTIIANRPIFRLKEVSISGEETFHPVRTLLPGILDERTLSGPVELDISAGEHRRTVEVLFTRRESDWEPIGGF